MSISSLFVPDASVILNCKATFYDAVYHAVALEHRGTLITADAAYHRKAHGKGRIMMLDELS